MLSTIAFIVLANQQQPTPAQLVSKMFARYHSAQTLTATIVTTVEYGGQSVTSETALQYERPSKFFLHQRVLSASGKEYLVVSDGKTFSYQAPEGRGVLNQGERLYEPVTANGASQGVPEIYAIGALAIADRSVALDALVAADKHLAAIRDNLVDLKLRGSSSQEGPQAYVIAAQWRDAPKMPVSASVELFITGDGDLLRFARSEMFTPDPAVPAQRLITVNQIRAVVNGPIDPAKFQVR